LTLAANKVLYNSSTRRSEALPTGGLVSSACDIFLSHVKEDVAVVEEIAQALDDRGYVTWYYERDFVPGEHWVVTIGRVTSECRAVVVVVSAEALENGHQVETEVFAAFEAHKRFFPLLRGVEFDEFKRRQPAWHVAAAGVAIRIPIDGVSTVVPSLLKGLKAAGIEPSGPAGPPTDELERGVAKIRSLLNDPDKLASAEILIRSLLERNPQSPQVYRLFGEFCNRSFRNADAVEAFEKAVGLDPANGLAHWDLALAYRQASRDEEMVASLRRALECGLDQSRQRHAMTLLSQFGQAASG
jgi:hypothetical protein